MKTLTSSSCGALQREILSEYTALSGRPEMPPLWSFGTWMSRISYFTEDEGRDVGPSCAATASRPTLSTSTPDGSTPTGNATMNSSPERFRNPRKMISDLAKDGSTSASGSSTSCPATKYFPELVSKGLAVKNGRGTLPYEDAVLDFTNPETVSWYQSKLGSLLEMGVGAIKVDFGEASPSTPSMPTAAAVSTNTTSTRCALQQGRCRRDPPHQGRQHHLGPFSMGRIAALSRSTGAVTRQAPTPVCSAHSAQASRSA